MLVPQMPDEPYPHPFPLNAMSKLELAGTCLIPSHPILFRLDQICLLFLLSSLSLFLQGLRCKFLLSQATVGGLTISLNSAVPQTNSAKPTTCSHLNDSQPRPSETSQMKSVRQVSIVLRAVAEIWRVTERPKKLKPL